MARKKFGAAVFMHPNCDRKDYIDNVIRLKHCTILAFNLHRKFCNILQKQIFCMYNLAGIL